MKRGRTHWTTKLLPSELQALHDWIDSEADYAAADIYRALNVRRYCKPRTFRQYVTSRRRARRAGEHEEGALPPSSFSLGSVEEMARAAVGKALLTGEMPAYVLPKLLDGIAKLSRAYTAQEAEKRAQELHERKMQQFRDAVKTATEDGAKMLTLGDVVDLVDQVMKGEAA